MSPNKLVERQSIDLGTIHPELLTRYAQLPRYSPLEHVSHNNYYVPFEPIIDTHAGVPVLEGSDALGQYLNAIGTIPLLQGSQQEVYLAKYIQAGLAATKLLESDPDQAEDYDAGMMPILRCIAQDGKQARETLIMTNLRYVVTKAKKFQGLGMDMIDLVNEGNIGLIGAADRFDWRRGFKFITFADQPIRQAISRAAHASPTLHMPESWKYDLRAARDRISDRKQRERKFGREAVVSIAELAAELNKPAADVADMLTIERRRHTDSIQETTSRDGEQFLQDILGDPHAQEHYDEVEVFLFRQAVIKAVKEIVTPFEFQVLVLLGRLGDSYEYTVKELSATFGCSEMHIYRTEHNAERKLRNPEHEEYFRDLLAGLLG